MSPFVATNKAPGVYIDEVQLPGPIAGVGTSIVAFLGPAQQGPLYKPLFLTNPTQFTNTFGGYITDPLSVYVTHAVHGFFDNGGTTCYFVRVGTGAQASLPLNDRAAAPRPTLVVTAQREGAAGNQITVQVQDASIASQTLPHPQATLANAGGATPNQATVTAAADAAKFHPGDVVLLEQGAKSEQATIAVIAAATITFQGNLVNTYTGGDLRYPDLPAGQTRLRVPDTNGFEPGSYVTITQGAKTESGIVRAVDQINKVIALSTGTANLYTLKAGDPDVTIKTAEFTLTITSPSAGAETFPNLSMDQRHSRYFANVVLSAAVTVALADPPTPTPPVKNLPAVIAATALAGGADDNIAAIQPLHYHKGIDTLEKLGDVNVLSIPDAAAMTTLAATQDVQAYMIAHCEKMQDRVTILDPWENPAPTAVRLDDIRTQRNLLASDNGYGAIYYPWIYISNPAGPGRAKVPPSGHIAGVWARVDNTRGVHKAPANEELRGAIALEQTLSDNEQGPLNEQGICVVRAFPGQGVVVWGARTIAPKDRTQWRYLNVRRLVLFVEKSIQEGTRFAVFEPNNLSLWQTLKRQVSEFLTRVWRDGALFGATPEEAFRVRVDEELNPPAVRALGQVVIEVVIYPVTPAEFVVFRIIQQPGGPTIKE